MANDSPSVAAPGSRGPITGTNPLSYAIPAGDGDPILLDIAMSTVAGGKVYAAHQTRPSHPRRLDRRSPGTPDHRREPLSPPCRAGPDGGHKGYGLGLLIEGLSALVTGAAVTAQVGGWMFGDPSAPTRHGSAFLALDIATMAGDAETCSGRASGRSSTRSTPRRRPRGSNGSSCPASASGTIVASPWPAESPSGRRRRGPRPARRRAGPGPRVAPDGPFETRIVRDLDPDGLVHHGPSSGRGTPSRSRSRGSAR